VRSLAARALTGAALALLLALPVQAADRWAASWSTAVVPLDEMKGLPADGGDFTIRQVVRLSSGGRQLRLRFTNALGTAPLRIDGAHVAHSVGAGSAAIAPGSDRAITFDGRPGVAIPPGAIFLSDPIDLPSPALQPLAVSLHLKDAPRTFTVHRAARTTAYVASGDQTAAADLPGAASLVQWTQIAAVDVSGPAVETVATFGDSITDGSGAGVDRYERWPDVLAQRLQADPKTRHIGVVNAGIGGNRLLKDGNGPNGLARFDRDVLSLPGLTTVIVLIGVNDIGTLSREGQVTVEKRQATVEGLAAGYRQLVERAHARNVRVIGATILPFGGTKTYRSDADADADRRAVNQWIRTAGVFDAVVDFDKVAADPADPSRLLAAFDSGDKLHPSPAGYQAMGSAVPLNLLVAPARKR